jgi:hypothetical protein
MSSNMSRRRRDEPPDDEEDDEPDEPDEPEVPDDDEVEYFVDPDVEDSVRTSVPNPLQSSQSWSSAPSTFVAVSVERSAPHISHWGMPRRRPSPVIKGTTERIPRAPGRRVPFDATRPSAALSTAPGGHRDHRSYS